MQVSVNPPGGEEEEAPSYIGVPSGYRPARYHYDPSTMGEDAAPVEYNLTGANEDYKGKGVDPKYKVGDENRPASWGAERIVELQAQMVDAGVLKASSYQRGIWDIASMNAYEKLLAMSNASGLDVDQTLSNYRQVKAKYGSDSEPETPRQPLIISRRDPEALRSLLGAVSSRIMGGALSPEEEDRFISSFNEMSDAAQRQEYEMSGSGKPGGPGGTITNIDPEAQAAKYLRENRPKDIVRHDVIERFDQFQSLLSKYS